MKRIAYWTQPNFYSLANREGKIQLLTLGFSHYVELARWSLQIQGIAFSEHAYSLGQHVLPVLAARICGEKNVISDSSFTSQKGDDVQDSKKANSARATAVPLAILPNNQGALADSWSIAAHSGRLAPIDDNLKELFDVKLGPLARKLVYSFILKPSNRSLWTALCTDNQPWWWRTLWFLFAGSAITNMLSNLFNPLDLNSVNKCRSDLREVILRCDKLLTNRKGTFLAGESLGVADIAFCSLMAPLVLPDDYANGMYFKNFSQLLAQDSELSEEVKFWRSTPSGVYCMNIYKEFRSKINLQ